MSDDPRELFAKAKGVAASARVAWSAKHAEPSRLRFATEHVQDRPEPAAPWGLDALRGRLVEISARGASATLTAAIDLVLEAQHAAEPVAWVTPGKATFYPPDVAGSGVDLAALAVVRVHDVAAAVRATERLLRSGSFGLIVVDLGGAGDGPGGGRGRESGASVPIAHQGRLVTLAQTHDTAVVCLTEKPGDAPSLGSLVSLRAEALRQRVPEDGYHVTLRVLKDKKRGPGFSRTTKLRGPPGYDD